MIVSPAVFLRALRARSPEEISVYLVEILPLSNGCLCVARRLCGRAAVKRPSLFNSVYSRTYVVFRQKRQRCHARTLVPVGSESHVRLLLLWAGELSRTGGHSDSQCAMNITTNSTTSDRMMCFVQ